MDLHAHPTHYLQLRVIRITKGSMYLHAHHVVINSALVMCQANDINPLAMLDVNLVSRFIVFIVLLRSIKF